MLLQDRGTRPKVAGPNTELSSSELMTLSCGVLFFLAFFIAMYVEVKAKNTIYQVRKRYHLQPENYVLSFFFFVTLQHSVFCPMCHPGLGLPGCHLWQLFRLEAKQSWPQHFYNLDIKKNLQFW